jgi:hypothetical protein
VIHRNRGVEDCHDVASGRTVTRTEQPTAAGAGTQGPLRRRLISLLLLVAAAVCFVGIVAVRQGPPYGGDTLPLITVSSAVGAGDLRAAAAVTSLPNPPGYALWTAPFVAAFPSSLGAPSWCTTVQRAEALRGTPGYRNDPTFARDVGECGSGGRGLPPWYRSQGALGVGSWLVLAVGSLALLRAGHANSVGREAGLLAFLAFLPAVSSTIVQLYHPQDLVSLGLALGGLALTLRQRWVMAGVLFGAAVLTKQFAVLLLMPALVCATDRRARFLLGGCAAATFVAGIIPFLAVAPRATLENFSGFSAGGATAGQTILTLMGVTGTVGSAVARDAPVIFAAAVCIWAARRWHGHVISPVGLVALALACASSRLVFESVVFPYYLLAASVLFFLLDLVARRSPYRSLAWSATAAFFVAFRPGNRAVDAFGTLLLAGAAVAAGLVLTRRVEVTEGHSGQGGHGALVR